MARSATPFTLSAIDSATLQEWLRKGALAQNLVQRARILLLLTEGFTPKEVSEQLQITASIVFKWRKRCLQVSFFQTALKPLPTSFFLSA